MVHVKTQVMKCEKTRMVNLKRASVRFFFALSFQT